MRALVATASTALALGLAACGGGSSADEGAAPATTAAAPSNGGATAPAETSTGTSTGTGGASAPIDGAQVADDNGCQACHQLPLGGAPGPGPDLRAIGAQVDAAAIEEDLIEGPGSMPSFAGLKSDEPEQFQALVDYLVGLK